MIPATVQTPVSPEGIESDSWALAGRLTELSGLGAVARTSLLVAEIVRLQEAGEPVAWVQPQSTQSLFPPDLAEAGVDLEELIFVRVPPFVADVLRSAELLLRSGGFALVAVDISGAEVPVAALSRLLGLARQHQCAVVFLSEREDHQPALGPLVSVRLCPERQPATTGFLIQPKLLRNKVGLGSQDPLVCAAPIGASSIDREVRFEQHEEAPRVALAS
ncbi:MAG: hypothetical protein AAGE52_30845 [Myxococcota bacterium]